MRGKFSSVFRELLLPVGLPLLLVLFAFWYAAQYVAPAPPGIAEACLAATPVGPQPASECLRPRLRAAQASGLQGDRITTLILNAPRP